MTIGSRANGAYDLLVAGGGPAGTSAAITAARLGARVLLLERGRFPRQKVCGEFVSPEALGLLQSLLSGNPEAEGLLRSAPRIAQARVFASDQCLEFPLAAPGASISRFDFDAALWHAAEAAGVEARQTVAVQNVEEGATFSVATSEGTFVARSVVDASGRWSNLNPAAEIRNGSSRRRQWMGIKAHFDEERSSPSADLYFFDGGYCGVQPAREGRVNACAMVRSDRARSLQEVFALNPRLQERSRDWRQATEAVVTAPLVFRAPRSLRSGVLLAGDSAGFLDPFAGDGISAALHSGALAAEALADFWRERMSLRQAALRYQGNYERALGPAFRTAGRIRWLLRLPAALHAPAAKVLRTSTVSRYLVSRTRTAIG
ncbi:MAG: NAD(P)/FAD-dependent oxidoreductase [Acidobacteriota bacterium]|nr:NAD(P)/FAD-dependent oxidoreductase [Acidobacteriota bacterium]